MRVGRVWGSLNELDGEFSSMASSSIRGMPKAVRKPSPAPEQEDRSLHEAVRKTVREHVGLDDLFIGATVTDGVVHLWGGVEEPVHKDAARVAAENVPGVRAVEDHIRVFPPSVRASLWAS